MARQVPSASDQKPTLSPSSVPYVSDVPTLVTYPSARSLTPQEIEAVKPFIDQWAASFKMDESKGFSSKMEILEATLLPKCKIQLHTRRESRLVENRRRPFDKKTMRNSGMTVDIQAFPMWSYDLSLKNARVEITGNEFQVLGSDEISTCEVCDGAGHNECPGCHGDKKITCPDCGGAGKVKCGGWKKGDTVGGSIIKSAWSVASGCGGTGQVKCGNCSGRGEVNLSSIEEKNTGRKTKRCPKCQGGQVTCSACRGSGEINCKKCNTRGEITCPTCSGRGRVICEPCAGHGQLISSYFIIAKENDLTAEKTLSSWGDLPAEVAAWLSTMGENKITTHELDRVSDEFLAKYPAGSEIALGIAALRDANRAEETWTSNDELLPIEFSAPHCRVNKEWVDEFYEPVCRVKYKHAGKSFELWLSIPRPTRAASKEDVKTPGHDHWRAGTFCFASQSPFSDAVDAWCTQAMVEKKAGKYPEALKLAKQALDVSPHHALAKDLSKKIRLSNAGMILATLIPLAAISSNIAFKEAVKGPSVVNLMPWVIVISLVTAAVLIAWVGRTRNKNLILGACLGIILGAPIGITAKAVVVKEEQRKTEVAAKAKAYAEQREKDRIEAEAEAAVEAKAAQEKEARERAEAEAKAAAERDRLAAEEKVRLAEQAEADAKVAAKQAQAAAEQARLAADERARLEKEAQALNECIKAAESGDVPSMLKLIKIYADGAGVVKNSTEAAKWCRKAADQGNPEAQDILGHYYADGTGVDKDSLEAVKWYRKAADQGNAKAQYSLGMCYVEGTGVPSPDETEALSWIRKSAENGLAEAQCILAGHHLQKAGGFPAVADPENKDVIEAMKWGRKAANQGNADGQFFLGLCYVKGIGVANPLDPANQTEGIKWLRKAAAQKQHDAEKLLQEYGKE